MRLRLLAVTLLLLIVAGQAVAAPAGQQQYIVKTRHVITQPHAKAAPSVQDVVRAGGGHVDYEWRDRLVVTIPDAAVQALMQHPAVDFVQKVASGIPEGGSAAVEGVDPVVTSSTFRPVPKSLPPWTSGTYSYDGEGNITAIGSNAYSYDAFSRLVTSTTNGLPETYTYDRYGNLKLKVTGTGSTALTVQSDVDDGNHLSGHCYDTAGNLTDATDPVRCPTATETHSFDALNMMTMKWNRTAGTKEYYIYNANDERIAVIPCSGTVCTEQITFSFRDESGKVLRQFEVPYQQFDSPWTWVEDYVYRDGVLLAAERVAAQGGRRHFHVDHLGTPRLITDSNGRRISEHDYFPFGVEATLLRQDTVPPNNFNREEPMKFTGHERDFTVGTSFQNSNYIDYMHARSTVPQWGRFLSVDPTWDSADLGKPQSWNRYAYVMNNPVAYTDPTGKIYELYGFVNDSDEQKLFQGLSTKTGLTVTNNNGRLDYARDANGNAIVAKDANGNQLGSGTARADLMNGINSTNRYIVQRTDNNPNVDMGVANGSLIRLDFADMRQINTGNNASATFDSSMIFLHEGVGHAFLGLHDPARQMLQSSNTLLQRQRGDTVNWENKIRTELSLPLRSQYRTEVNQQRRRYIPFANGPVWLP